MLNDSLLQLSINDFKNILLDDLSLYDMALTYILVYVIYKILGRYIYFKPQEHSSKVNRTFLVLALLATVIHLIGGFTDYLPVLEEYSWLYIVSVLILLIAPLSIIADRIIWRYGDRGHKYERYRYYLPIEREYYKTARTVNTGSGFNHREEEGVRSTGSNIHSDALLNILALVVFIVVAADWAHASVFIYGKYSYLFSAIITFWVSIIFIDRGIISWIEYFEEKYYRFLENYKPKIKSILMRNR